MSESNLPGSAVASGWNTIGGLILGVHIIIFIVIVVAMETIGAWGVPLLVCCAISACLISIIPFSIAALLNAINVNTLEIMSLRVDFKETMEQQQEEQE